MVAWWTGVECRIEPISEVKDILRYTISFVLSLNLMKLFAYILFIFIWRRNKEYNTRTFSKMILSKATEQSHRDKLTLEQQHYKEVLPRTQDKKM